jgi:hypothetical protein
LPDIASDGGNDLDVTPVPVDGESRNSSARMLKHLLHVLALATAIYFISRKWPVIAATW